jgi:hypothetical protein
MGNTRDVVWKFYFKDRDSELAQSAAAKYETRKRLLTSNAGQNAALRLIGPIEEVRTPAQEQRLIEGFNNKKVLKAAKKFFDRSFSIMVLEDAGTKKLHIRFVHEDNGQKWMTAACPFGKAACSPRSMRI